MVPKAKKKLHECKHHLEKFLKSKNFEEAEILFSAFVTSGRSVTWALHTEFNKIPRFIEWYGDPKEEKPPIGTKVHEMKNDELCKFFVSARNVTEKKGVSKLDASTYVISMKIPTDFPNRPTDSLLQIGGKGNFHHIHKGTSKEDIVPAESTAKIITSVYISNPPKTHLDKNIENPNNPYILAKIYYHYLKNLVEEWTGIINSSE